MDECKYSKVVCLLYSKMSDVFLCKTNCNSVFIEIKIN